jgi:hypothetical protein
VLGPAVSACRLKSGSPSQTCAHAREAQLSFAVETRERLVTHLHQHDLLRRHFVQSVLRRRFAFVNLEPKFGDAWRKWVVAECGVDSALVHDVERRLADLNRHIAGDLGNQFRIGHSYVTPTQRLEIGTTKDWFKEVVETEIGPLLDEYWFDSPKTAKEAFDQLMEGW